jgi:4-cresol dehydrogenase (hydroxylating)
VIRNFPLVGYGIPSENAESPDELCWSLRYALYGRESLVEAHYEVVHDALATIPGLRLGRRTFRGDGERTGVTLHDDKVQGGVPGMELMDAMKARWGEDFGHIDLSTIGPFSGADVLDSIRVRRELSERYGIPYAAGIIMLPRSVLHISSLMFDTNDERETRASYEAYGEMVVELARAGYPIYRTNIQHMDLVADQFDFNDHAQRRLNEQLKDLLDPNGILSPGKQGIWPKSMR